MSPTTADRFCCALRSRLASPGAALDKALSTAVTNSCEIAWAWACDILLLELLPHPPHHASSNVIAAAQHKAFNFFVRIMATSPAPRRPRIIIVYRKLIRPFDPSTMLARSFAPSARQLPVRHLTAASERALNMAFAEKFQPKISTQQKKLC